MNAKQRGNNRQLLQGSLVLLVTLLLFTLIVAGCTAGLDAADNPTPGGDEAVQLPQEARAYVEMSRQELARHLGLSVDEITLESVTEPAAADGTYIIKLLVEDRDYEYHGRNEEVLLVSEPLPPAKSGDDPTLGSERLVFQPAPVEGVEVQIDPEKPEPATVIVRGNLPNDCSEIHEGRVHMPDNRSFAVSLSMRRPAGKACAEVLVPYETAVSLGVQVSELPDGEYRVIVNDQVAETFALNRDEASGKAAGSLPQVSFVLDEAVAAASDVSNVAAVEQTENTPFWALYPEHVEVSFEGYRHPDSRHRPRIYVYPVRAFQNVNDTAAEQIEKLRQLLAQQPQAAPQELPFLPLLNAGQMMRAQMETLAFSNGSGVRYLTQYGQAAAPINNSELFYTYQGLTADGQYYVAAIFPVAHPELPADASGAPQGLTGQLDFGTYLDRVVMELEAAETQSFSPGLEALDALIASLNVGGDA